MGKRPKNRHVHETASNTRKSPMKTKREAPTNFRTPPLNLDLRAFDRQDLDAAIAEVTRPGRINLAVSAEEDFDEFSTRINENFIILDMQFKLRMSPPRKETKRALETTRNLCARLKQSLPVFEKLDETFGRELVLNNEITRLILPHFEERLCDELYKEQAEYAGITHADLFGGMDAAESLIVLSQLLGHLEKACHLAIDEIDASTEERRKNPFCIFCESLIPIYAALFGTRAAASEGNSKPSNREHPDAGPAVRFILHCLQSGKRNGAVPDGASLPSISSIAGWINDYNKDHSTKA